MTPSTRGATFKPKVIVAIDFGTHGTGFAWATVSALQDSAGHRVVVYQPFTQSGGHTYPKDLSAVLVNRAGDPVKFGEKARNAWDRELARGNPQGFGYASKFKMAIHGREGKSDIPEFLGSLAGARRDTVKVLVTAMLTHVRGAALEQIGRYAVGGAAYTADEIRWCLTIPAMWTEADRQFMRSAAVSAGLPGDAERLLLVQEPEAAAVYCALNAGTVLGPDRPEGQLEVDTPGSRFMVVDCGGGTVDITSYQIRAEDVGPGQLKETRVADGDRLGSAYVNHAFVTDVLTDRFGEQQLKQLIANFPKEIGQLETEWETEKVRLVSETAADGTPVITDTVLISIPGKIWDALDAGTRTRLTVLASGETHYIEITAHEVTTLFESVVRPILSTIERQRAAASGDGPAVGREQMLLVGGFARSTYLRDRIAQRFGHEVRVITPMDPAVAVLGGAVHFAYDPSVIWGRRSKYTYGFGCSMPFRHGIDPQEKFFIDDDGNEKCNDRFVVMARRGDLVPTDHKAVSTVAVFPAWTTVQVTIHATYAHDPDYTDEEGCEAIGKVIPDISGSVGLPTSERSLDVAFSFGTTEIEVEVRDRRSGAARRAEVAFDDLYGRGSTDRPDTPQGR
ncbi:hypothetical protein SABIM44S_04891 [Streptomyces abikoensis]